MKFSRRFTDEYKQFRAHFDWFSQREGNYDDVPYIKSILAEMRTFLKRWTGRSGVPQMDMGLASLAPNVRALEKTIESLGFTALHEVLDARKTWIESQLTFEMAVQFNGLMKEADAAYRLELEKTYREHMGREFDPTHDYIAFEKSADDAEAAFQKTWQKYRVEWPERAADALYQRIRIVDGEELIAWMQELAREQAAFDKK